ncbi:MAG: hypothetical protein QOI81_67, partial [Actinomycetota bacterium]|nr:hypothetical protein [Actinomycetota bacterium]
MHCLWRQVGAMGRAVPRVWRLGEH